MPTPFSALFPKPKPVIAMIHTGPSPGVPGFICIQSAVERAVAEAEVYLRAGVDGILNAGYDTPATRWPDFETGRPPRPAVLAVRREDGGRIGD